MKNSTLPWILGIVAVAIITGLVTYIVVDKQHQPTAAPVVQHDTVKVVEKQVVTQPAAPQTSTARPVRETAAPRVSAPDPAAAGTYGLWPQTSQRRLQAEELYGMSSHDLRLMRNEIYARHGYIFASADLRQYFSNCPWYTPRSKNVNLTSVEQYNVGLIKSFE